MTHKCSKQASGKHTAACLAQLVQLLNRHTNSWHGTDDRSGICRGRILYLLEGRHEGISNAVYNQGRVVQIECIGLVEDKGRRCTSYCESILIRGRITLDFCLSLQRLFYWPCTCVNIIWIMITSVKLFKKAGSESHGHVLVD